MLHGLVALKRKGLRKTHTILSSAISEWKWPSAEIENDHESETILSVVYDNDFDSDSSNDEIHLTS